MEVEKNSVVEFRYSLVDENDQLVANTEPQNAAILQGRRNVVLGVERALLGRKKGDRFTVDVPSEEGYGPRREDWTQRVSKKYFSGAKRLKVGAVTHLNLEKGVRPVTVIKVGGKFIDVDLNHPHAGQNLRFDIELLEVRTATQEEIAHGHAHGAHGEQH